MNALEELVKQCKEVERQKKGITLSAGLIVAVGITIGIAGAFVEPLRWVCVILGAVIVIGGLTFFFILRGMMNKMERKVIDVLDGAEIPKAERDRLKSELGLK